MGECRDESGNYEFLETYNGYSLEACRVRCQIRFSCTAFAYFSDKRCNLYKFGPYTQGTGDSGVQCYSLKGIFSTSSNKFSMFIIYARGSKNIECLNMFYCLYSACSVDGSPGAGICPESYVCASFCDATDTRPVCYNCEPPSGTLQNYL